MAPVSWEYWGKGYLNAKGVSIPVAVSVLPDELSGTAKLGRVGVSQTHPLQQARQRRALCGLGTAATLFRRGSCGLQTAAQLIIVHVFSSRPLFVVSTLHFISEEVIEISRGGPAA